MKCEAALEIPSPASGIFGRESRRSNDLLKIVLFCSFLGVVDGISAGVCPEFCVSAVSGFWFPPPKAEDVGSSSSGLLEL
jgi:hypothetical protein